MSAKPINVQVWTNESFTALARVVGSDNRPLKQSDVASITRTIARAADGYPANQTPATIDKTVVISDVERFDFGWNEFEGWNFCDTSWPVNSFMYPHVFEVCYVITCTNSFVTKCVFRVYAKRTVL